MASELLANAISTTVVFGGLALIFWGVSKIAKAARKKPADRE